MILYMMLASLDGGRLSLAQISLGVLLGFGSNSLPCSALSFSFGLDSSWSCSSNAQDNNIILYFFLGFLAFSTFSPGSYAWRELCRSQPSVMLLFMFLLHTSTHSIKLASNCSQTPLSFSYS
ncbi:hypothetical protein Peur_032170 [Populus x canadensis]